MASACRVPRSPAFSHHAENCIYNSYVTITKQILGRHTGAAYSISTARTGASAAAINQQLTDRLPTRASADKNWVDPIIGVRAQWNLNEKWFLAGKSDVGGFEVGSDLAWAVQGTVGYNFTENVSAELGYRYLDTDYSDGNFTYDLAEHGLFMGVNVKF